MIPNIDRLKADEASRREQILAELEDTKNHGLAIKKLSKKTGIKAKILMEWVRGRDANGFDGLKPEDWEQPTPEAWKVIKQRKAELGEVIDDLVLSKKIIQDIAGKNNWSEQKAKRRAIKYREGGLLALDSTRKKAQKRKKKKRITALGTASATAVEQAIEDRQLIEPLLGIEKGITKAVKQLAKETGKAEKTIWTKLRNYKNHGFEGIVRSVRSDTGGFHGISPKIIKLVKDIRLANSSWNPVRVMEEAARIANTMGEIPPSEGQVRRILKTLTPGILDLVDGKDKAFKNTYEFSGRYPDLKDRVVWQIDDTPAAILLNDLRPDNVRNNNGVFRPTYFSAIDERSRKELVVSIWYDKPDRFGAGALIRDAILVGGKPDEIKMDSGRYFISDYMRNLLEHELKIKVTPFKHRPDKNGRVERLFGTIETKLLSTLKGYTGPDIKNRNQHIKVELDIYDLEQKFKQFIDEYNNEIHSQTGETPNNRYNEIPTEQVDPRLLDILLMEPVRRVVSKDGISHNKTKFRSTELAGYIGRSVLVRARPSYEKKSYIEVFYNNEWICTAWDTDNLGQFEVHAAKKGQRSGMKNQINTAEESYQEILETVGERFPVDQSAKPPIAQKGKKRNSGKQNKSGKGKSLAKDLLRKQTKEEGHE